MTGDMLLSIRGLHVRYHGQHSVVHVLRNIDIDIPRDAVVGIVGESGSGKSTLALALMGLLPPNGEATAATVRFNGEYLPSLRPQELARFRGRGMSMVFQDPMSALNPLFCVGTQLVDIQRAQFPSLSRRELWTRAHAMLDRVGVSEAADRMRRYPHELSGGMRQRVMIAMALLVQPALLLADEPTTALDATIEAQIVELLHEIRKDIRGSMILVSHSLGLVADLCDHVIVMYAGSVVESGSTQLVFGSPQHPYTQALLSCEIDPFHSRDNGSVFGTIPGSVPELIDPPKACIFADRCPARISQCGTAPKLKELSDEQTVACWLR